MRKRERERKRSPMGGTSNIARAVRCDEAGWVKLSELMSHRNIESHMTLAESGMFGGKRAREQER